MYDTCIVYVRYMYWTNQIARRNSASYWHVNMMEDITGGLQILWSIALKLQIGKDEDNL
jgi:hypothetical protein